MDKSIARFIDIIENTKNINSCIKNLNLDYNSCFLCFLKLIEDSIVNYKEGFDYSFLCKVSNYLERVYNKLTIKEKELHRKQILILRKIYKRHLCSLMRHDRRIFEKVYLNLEILLISKKEKIKIDITNDELGELLYNILFNFKNLEYLDKVIEKNPNILNCYYDNKDMFSLVIEKYLSYIGNDDDLVCFYERVINKFLLEKTFNLTDDIKNKIICDLNNFVNNKRLNINNLNKIKKIIECLNNKDNIFEMFNIQSTIPNLILSDKEYLELKKSKSNNRTNIKGYTITIDGEETKVYDDAISKIQRLSNGNYLYMVHIADPLYLLPYYSKTMNEAKRRTTTIYLKDTSIPMINPYFSEDKLSLIKGQNRFTKTFCIEFDKYFNIIDFKILNSIINVSDRLSYDSLNELYNKGGSNNDEYEILDNYDKLISSLKKIFKNAPLYEEVKKNNIIGNSKNMSSFSENLISYSMLLVGYLTAKYFEEHNLPFVYRCHKIDEEWVKLLDDFSHDTQNNEIKKIINSIKGDMPKSYYSRLNDKHMGLNLPYYSHITSPLRRYMDNLNMHAVDLCYFNNPSDKELYDLQFEMDTSCDYINMQSNTIDECITKKLIK